MLLLRVLDHMNYCIILLIQQRKHTFLLFFNTKFNFPMHNKRSSHMTLTTSAVSVQAFGNRTAWHLLKRLRCSIQEIVKEAPGPLKTAGKLRQSMVHICVSPTGFGVAPSITQRSESPEHRVSVFEVIKAEFNARLIAVMNHSYLKEDWESEKMPIIITSI